VTSLRYPRPAKRGRKPKRAIRRKGPCVECQRDVLELIGKTCRRCYVRAYMRRRRRDFLPFCSCGRKRQSSARECRACHLSRRALATVGPRACRSCQKTKDLVNFPAFTGGAIGRRRICKACYWRKRYASGSHRPAIYRRRNAKARGVLDEFQWQSILEFYSVSGVPICAHCQAKPAEHMDHIVALSRGGEHAPWNVCPSCASCNLQKGTRTIWPARRHPFMEKP